MLNDVKERLFINAFEIVIIFTNTFKFSLNPKVKIEIDSVTWEKRNEF